MDRRAEVRFAVDRPIKVTFLGQQNRAVDAVIADVSAVGMRIVLAQAAPLDAPIRIDLDDAMILGEVCHCSPQDGGFTVGIRFCHSLMGLDQLAKLRSRFLHDRLPVALN